MTWHRVTKRNPCPVCGKPDWCLVSADGSAAICPRVESARQVGDAGWLHILRDRPPVPELQRTIRTGTLPRSFGKLAAEAERSGRKRLPELARTLGVSVDSLSRLRVGWSDRHRAWTFPMTDAAGRVTGIRIRFPSGRKLAVRGGREALFVPRDLPSNLADRVLLLPEGATDTAAALDLGALAVGRPSCSGGTRHVVRLVKDRPPACVCVVGDADEPGRRGAWRLAERLRPYVHHVRVVVPPAKDIRAWIRAGATGGQLRSLVERAQPLGLRLEKEIRHVMRRSGFRVHGKRRPVQRRGPAGR